MGRVTFALIRHELLERTRDRWVVVISVLFALLAAGVGLYGQNAGDQASGLIGPSLVTLTSLFVPLVALVLGHDAVVGERERNTLGLLLSLPFSKNEMVVAKFVGRLLALVAGIAFGLGGAAFFIGDSAVLWRLLGESLLLGAAFLSLGILISSLTHRQVTAASLVVCAWFLFVFFYDLGLLGLLVATDGAVSQGLISHLVLANPSGLFRVQLLAAFSGSGILENLGISTGLPGNGSATLIWAGWILVPLLLSGIILHRQKAIR